MNTQMLLHTELLYFVTEVMVYFDIFGVEYVPQKIKEFIGNKNIIANIFWVQANSSIMCWYFCIGFIDFMFAGKKLTDFTSLFSAYDFEKNDGIILISFEDDENW